MITTFSWYNNLAFFNLAKFWAISQFGSMEEDKLGK